MGETRFAQTKRPFLTQCHPFSLCGQAAQPVIPVTGRLGNKCKQLRMKVCWKITFCYLWNIIKGILNKLYVLEYIKSSLILSNVCTNDIFVIIVYDGVLLFIALEWMSLCLLSFFLDRCCFPGNQAKSTLHDCQHRPLRACRPVEDRIRSLPMTETSGVWAKRICRTVIGKRSKAKSVLGGGFFLFGTFSFWPRRKKKYTAYVNGKFTRKKWA